MASNPRMRWVLITHHERLLEYFASDIYLQYYFAIEPKPFSTITKVDLV
jgi:hypothetical protein